jgi:hypothetical protein
MLKCLTRTMVIYVDPFDKSIATGRRLVNEITDFH